MKTPYRFLTLTNPNPTKLKIMKKEKKFKKIKNKIICFIRGHYPILRDNSPTQMMCGRCKKHNL